MSKLKKKGSKPTKRFKPKSNGVDDTAQIEHYANVITAEHQKCASSIIETGRLLIEAKAAVEHGGWLMLVRKKLPFKERTAQMFMEIAEHPVISNPKFISYWSPSWGTLYELTAFNEPQLLELIEGGKITCSMTRDDVKALKETDFIPLYRFPEALDVVLHFMGQYQHAGLLVEKMWGRKVGKRRESWTLTANELRIIKDDLPKWFGVFQADCQSRYDDDNPAYLEDDEDKVIEAEAVRDDAAAGGEAAT